MCKYMQFTTSSRICVLLVMTLGLAAQKRQIVSDLICLPWKARARAKTLQNKKYETLFSIFQSWVIFKRRYSLLKGSSSNFCIGLWHFPRTYFSCKKNTFSFLNFWVFWYTFVFNNTLRLRSYQRHWPGSKEQKKEASSHLFQKPSIILQHGNATLFLNCTPDNMQY